MKGLGLRQVFPGRVAADRLQKRVGDVSGGGTLLDLSKDAGETEGCRLEDVSADAGFCPQGAFYTLGCFSLF